MEDEEEEVEQESKSKKQHKDGGLQSHSDSVGDIEIGDDSEALAEKAEKKRKESSLLEEKEKARIELLQKAK